VYLTGEREEKREKNEGHHLQTHSKIVKLVDALVNEFM